MNDSSDLTLRNGCVVTPTGVIRGGLAVKGGLITHVGADSALPLGATDVDVAGKIIFPGLIDPHVHLGLGVGWGPEKMERDFVTETRDAAAGGVTTLVTTSVFGQQARGEAIEAEISWGNRHSCVDFRISAVLTTREHLREITEVVKLGVRSFKLFTGYHGEQALGFGMSSEGVPWDFFYEACERIGEAGPKVFPMIHAEDPAVREMLVERCRGQADSPPLRAWANACPSLLEPMQIYPAALIAHEVRVPLYIVHTSAWQSVGLIRTLKSQGWDIFGETLAAFLYWTAEEGDAKDLGTLGKIQPPIRSARDREALWTGINDETITLVGSDSGMFTRESRQVDFWDAQVGLGPQMGTLLPVMYTCGVKRGNCSLERLARLLAEDNARRFDLYPRKGVLQVGSEADIVVFDPESSHAAHASDLPSAGGYTVYEGESLYGWPDRVYLRGHMVAQHGKPTDLDPMGRFVPTA